MEGLRCQLPVPRLEKEGAEKHVVWPIFVSARLSVQTPGYREDLILAFQNRFSYSVYSSTAFLKNGKCHFVSDKVVQLATKLINVLQGESIRDCSKMPKQISYKIIVYTT